jgi:hypothetical protein
VKSDAGEERVVWIGEGIPIGYLLEIARSALGRGGWRPNRPTNRPTLTK